MSSIIWFSENSTSLNMALQRDFIYLHKTCLGTSVLNVTLIPSCFGNHVLCCDLGLSCRPCSLITLSIWKLCAFCVWPWIVYHLCSLLVMRCSIPTFQSCLKKSKRWCFKTVFQGVVQTLMSCNHEDVRVWSVLVVTGRWSFDWHWVSESISWCQISFAHKVAGIFVGCFEQCDLLKTLVTLLCYYAMQWPNEMEEAPFSTIFILHSNLVAKSVHYHFTFFYIQTTYTKSLQCT